MTYSNNIRSNNTFNLRYAGLRVIISSAAMRELYKHGKSLWDVIDILENGSDAPRKRGRDTIDRWLQKHKKTYNAVVVKDYNEKLKEECWVLIHFGIFTSR